MRCCGSHRRNETVLHGERHKKYDEKSIHLELWFHTESLRIGVTGQVAVDGYIALRNSFIFIGIQGMIHLLLPKFGSGTLL